MTTRSSAVSCAGRRRSRPGRAAGRSRSGCWRRARPPRRTRPRRRLRLPGAQSSRPVTSSTRSAQCAKRGLQLRHLVRRGALLRPVDRRCAARPAAGCRRRTPRTVDVPDPAAQGAAGPAARARPARRRRRDVVAVRVQHPPPSAATMPAPPSVVALPPMPRTTCVQPASSAAPMTSPSPRLVAVSGASRPPGSRHSPDTSAISTTAVSPRRAYAVRPARPWVRPPTGTRSKPAATAASTVPSPPSATGTVTTSASGTAGRCRRRARRRPGQRSATP